MAEAALPLHIQGQILVIEELVLQNLRVDYWFVVDAHTAAF